jgi:hypothetical protein
MKELLRVVLFHFICIIIFTFLYFNFKDSFSKNNYSSKKDQNFLDFLLLSTTVQASVGITVIYPIDDIGKTLMIIQQFMMLCTHVFTLYFLTL